MSGRDIKQMLLDVYHLHKLFFCTDEFTAHD
jgi:hypothetical protein